MNSLLSSFHAPLAMRQAAPQGMPLLTVPPSRTVCTARLAGRPLMLAVLAVSALVLSACTSTRLTSPAPVEDRSASAAGSRPATSAVSLPALPAVADPAKPPPPGIENAGKPGYYTVRPGDRLIRISLEAGQNWRDIVRWNNLDNPDRIEVGQVLRIVPPTAGMAASASSAPSVPSAAPAAPADHAASTAVTASAVNNASVAAQPLPTPAATSPVSRPVPPPPPPAARNGEDDVSFIWPAKGSVVSSFDEQKNKGVGIAGKAGDPVLAAAEGRVVYAGSGLRGYGNLIILKHNNTFLTAYAHNQALLVKEDQDVKQGQKIAEMGNSDADRVKLHFEVRRNGKPVDPARFLPSR